jgi:predicted nucleic acid-binding protein
MRPVVISDSSCLIALLNIGRLDLLCLVYGSVLITPEVASEVNVPLPEWVVTKSALKALDQHPWRNQVDLGEASAIAPALEVPQVMLVLDDLAARRVAKRLGIPITGTVGVIAEARKQAHITAIKPVLEALREVSFRLSDEVVEEILRSAGE